MVFFCYQIPSKVSNFRFKQENEEQKFVANEPEKSVFWKGLLQKYVKCSAASVSHCLSGLFCDHFFFIAQIFII